jgi:hypothetical protein
MTGFRFPTGEMFFLFACTASNPTIVGSRDFSSSSQQEENRRSAKLTTHLHLDQGKEAWSFTSSHS